MALVMYLIKAPRYKNIATDVYETIPIKELTLIDKYFFWTMLRYEGKTDACTLEEWCGIPESKMPHKYVVNYYREYFTKKKFYKEYCGETEGFTIFSQQARIVKANQIFRWFIEHVMSGRVDDGYHEVTRTQLAKLLHSCKQVRERFVEEDGGGLGEKSFVVDELYAKSYLPLMEEQGYFFGTDKYDSMYAANIIDTIHAVENILDTTDFEKEVVYFNASW